MIPAVDVLDGEVVRLRQGMFDDVTVYAADPAVAARSWVDEGASLVHVVDLIGARTGKPDRQLWARLNDANVEFQVGGGIRSVEVGSQALNAGARRVVLGSAAIWSPEVPAELVDRFGADRVVGAVDVRDGLVVGSGWEGEGYSLEQVCQRLAELGVTWILATGIERDGMLNGPDTSLLERIRRLVPEVRLIASGGVADLDDIAALRDGGYEAVITGRALYENRFTLEEAINVASE